ncbi:hypothetical protein [Pseudonocardia humida]|uniref:Patatin-like phospholipase n=1 Tax=Pseudonocardia humida TaxID=2800819 RepID=A0ABT1A5H7_9PSEU|nr:hypothetical protein [Pseudonocardia humida]MCO1658276.1 hypothetical protein [Pseudonocardia humida]
MQEALVRAAGWLAGRPHRAALGYVLALLAGGLLLMLRQIDAVLGRMSAIGDGVRADALAFPWAPDTIARYARAWDAYEGRAMPGTGVVADVDVLHGRMVGLDLAFVATYVPLLAMALGLLLRWADARFEQPLEPVPDAVAARPFLAALREDAADEARRLWRLVTGRGPADGDPADPAADPDPHRPIDRRRFDAARVRMLRWAVCALAVLAVVDLAEHVLLHLRYVVMDADDTRFDPVLSGVTWVKTLAFAVVVGPAAVAAASALRVSRPLRGALAGARGVVVVVGLLVVLLVLLPMGAAQIDDVVRAWGGQQALVAVLATVAAALVVVGAVRELTSDTPECLRPYEGRDPQPLLLLVGVGLAAVGTVVWLVTGAWGLLVPAGTALGVFVLGAVVDRPAADGANAPGARAHHHEPDADDDREAQRVAGHGRRLAHLLGAGVCLVTAWTVARASTYDVLVRPGPSGSLWVLAPAATAAALTGLVLAVGSRRVRWPRPLWVVPGVLAFGVLWTTMIGRDATAVALPTWIGSLGVVMVGVAAACAILALLVMLVRRSGVDRYALVPLFRLVGLRRFPVIALLLVWGLVVAQLDGGGFHDVRRDRGETRAAPNLLDAYTDWRGSGTGTGGGARPLVVVAAQGGGIRAATWTALVMECLFGPTEVEPGCPGGPGRRLPVLIASGASGGSVGLAAWSARRLDLAESAPAPPIDRVLPADHLAPDLARLLSGDALYQLLAHDLPDRAEMLERSWELAWDEPDDSGLNRGLRESWELANSAGRWEMPVLAFTGTQVEDGCRFVAGPVDLWLPGPTGATTDAPDDVRCGAASAGAVDALPRTTELVDYLCADEDVPMSAAAHLSSRFPYVSPSARIAAGDCADRAGLLPAGSTTFLTDGGLADNSGAATAVQLWRALQPVVAEDEGAGCVVPIFVQIDNTPDVEPDDAGTRPPVELTAPLSALFGQIGGREEMEREEARTAFAEVRTAGGEPVPGGSGPSYVRIAPSVQPGAEAPLGWALSPSTVRDMRAQLTTGTNAAEIDRLRGLLDGLTCPS